VVTRQLPKLYRSLNAYLIEHPVASWIMWVLGILLVVPSIQIALEPKVERFGLLSWMCVVNFAWALLFLHPRVIPLPPRDAIGIRWSAAQATWFFPWVAVFSDSPQWLVSLGLLETVVLMAVSLSLARADARASTGDEGEPTAPS